MKVCLDCGANIDTDGWHCSSCHWQPEFDDGFPLMAPGLAADGGSFQPESHDVLAGIEGGSFWFVSRNKLLCDLLDVHFPFAAKMLEVGCGTGFVLAGIARHRSDMELHGAEVHLSGLRHARKRLPQVRFVQMDACRIPFQDEFDVIGVFDVLEHLEEDQMALCRIHRALRKGGGVMVTVPQHPWLWSHADEHAGHKRRYTRKNLVAKMSAAGFQDIVVTSFVTFLFPFMVVFRYSSGMRGNHRHSSTTGAGLALPGIVNSVFMKICDLERSCIKAGLPLPFGGSLVCIAKKKSR